MKLSLTGTGREVRVVAPQIDSKSRATLWQGETENGVPVMALVVMLSPLIEATDPRQDEFERDYNVVMDSTELHPAVESFPSEVQL